VGLDSCCSSGILAGSAEDEEGPDSRSSKEGGTFAFPFPLSRGSVRGAIATTFPLSLMDLGSVGGRHRSPLVSASPLKVSRAE
jgi:hypothetical protein